MKWGVRKDAGHEGERAKTKKIGKLDKKFEKNATSLDTFIKINNKPSENQNMGSLRERQRIGTSISKKMRGMDKF